MQNFVKCHFEILMNQRQAVQIVEVFCVLKIVFSKKKWYSRKYCFNLRNYILKRAQKNDRASLKSSVLRNFYKNYEQKDFFSVSVVVIFSRSEFVKIIFSCLKNFNLIFYVICVFFKKQYFN
eukprot:TRINITY_DN29315_c1_g2_i1.p2 TRINITY_DN29315_c1_g2~~TRINITY_DN29315_c1_g2_i1.p2  ORF type:complete len:122 (+),score=6.60 TRINITY_DN29315_c1_g2_i1:154-519(+)